MPFIRRFAFQLVTLVPLLASSRALAQEERTSGLTALLQWSPIIFLVVLWVFISLRMRPQMKQQKEHLARQREHFERVEAQLSELNGTLRRLVESAQPGPRS